MKLPLGAPSCVFAIQLVFSTIYSISTHLHSLVSEAGSYRNMHVVILFFVVIVARSGERLRLHLVVPRVRSLLAMLEEPYVVLRQLHTKQAPYTYPFSPALH